MGCNKSMTIDYSKRYWAVLYLHDWDESGKIYPQIHSLHETYEEARDEKNSKKIPEKYWVNNVYLRNKDFT